MLLQLVQKPQGQIVQDIALSQHAEGRLPAVRGRADDDRRPRGLVGIYQGGSRAGPVASRAAHIRYGDKCLVSPGWSPPRPSSRPTARSTPTIRSVPVAVGGRGGGDPAGSRRALHRARGDTWQSLAERSGGAIKPATLAVDEPRRRQRGAACRRADQDRGGGLRWLRGGRSARAGLGQGAWWSWRCCSPSSCYVYLTLPDVRVLATTNPTTTAFMELRAAEARAKGARSATCTGGCRTRASRRT